MYVASFICICNCSECSSMEKSTNTRYSFSKLLAATSVVILIVMCLKPSEALSVEHKIRHERHEIQLDLTTERMRTPVELLVEHRLRPHSKLALLHRTKNAAGLTRQQKNEQADQFKVAMTKIKKKLRNTRGFFNEERRVLNETKDYRDGMPSWLPSNNFVDIHFHNYKKSTRRTNATNSEKKFTFLIPKLYKSLVEFQVIFKHLAVVEVSVVDDVFYNYSITRRDLINKTLGRLYATIAEVEENMRSVGVPIPPMNPDRKLKAFEVKIDAPQCLKNDYIAFRAYGNLLNNWYMEFRCPRGKRVTNENVRCIAFEAKLREKKELRMSREKKVVS